MQFNIQLRTYSGPRKMGTLPVLFESSLVFWNAGHSPHTYSKDPFLHSQWSAKTQFPGHSYDHNIV